MPNCILIATPTYNRTVTSSYTESLVVLASELSRHGHSFRYATLDSADIAASRNAFASQVYNDASLTHLLFIDSDISFLPRPVIRMLALGVPVAGCVYPKRRLNIDKVIALARKLDDTQTILAMAQEFVVSHEASLRIEAGVCKVNGIGMGLCLIERGALVRLVETGTIRSEKSPLFSNFLTGLTYGFFDPMNGLSEDLSFCQRWRTTCGGEIHAVVDEVIGHTGPMQFQSSYFRKLVTLNSKPPGD
jgi:hypothetical protein